MAKETIQAVRQAELNAEQTEKNAQAAREKLISKTLQEAKALTETMTKEAIAQAKKKLEEADGQGEKLLKEASSNAEKEIVLLKQLAGQKEQEAVKAVLAQII